MTAAEAAEGGEMRAAVNLGLLYMDGTGTDVDFVEALKWTKMAADEDQPIGLNNMGHIYENGLGVDVDLALAKTYYEQSAAQGYQLAIDNLARLNEGGRPAGGGKTKSK